MREEYDFSKGIKNPFAKKQITINIEQERKNIPTKLQIVRRAIGLSQKELSEKSGVTLRMIQQYEHRAKDINKTVASNLFALAQALGCEVEDLLE